MINEEAFYLSFHSSFIIPHSAFIFASSQELKLKLTVEIVVEATGSGQLSDQKIEETKIALRELGLDDQVEVG